MYRYTTLKCSISLMISGLLFNALQAFADMTVISVDGPVVSAQPYFLHLGVPIQADTLNSNILNIPVPAVVNDVISFPITSTRLSAGQVTPAAVHYPELAQPFFLIGSDAASQAWLNRYQNRLQAIHAVGFLVQAASKTDWQRMKALAGNLPLVPAKGDIFAERFGIQHYPVLIADKRIEQ